MTEHDEILGELVSFYGQSPLYPSKEQWQSVLSCKHSGKVMMLNLLKLKEEAINPYDEAEKLSGFELIQRYQDYSLRAVENVKGVPGFSGMVIQSLIGTGDWDIVGMVEYPDIEAFIAVFQDPDYRKGHRYRKAACINHQLLIIAPA
jgi:uncharacterized protein (DUF1330 family)